MPRRTALLLAAPALVLLLAGCGGSSAPAPTTSPATSSATQPASPTPTTTSPATPTATSTATTPDVLTVDITVEKGAVTPTPGNIAVPLGSEVRLSVTSDVADEIHVHGYDVEKSVRAGGTATLEFTADQSGTFEVETHESDLLLAKLVVS